MNKLFLYVKASFVITSVLCFFYRANLFVEYAKTGASVANNIQNVVINNHGIVSYISKKQDERLGFLLGFSVVTFLTPILIDLIGKCFLKRQRKDEGL
ncbi:hypothetical protein [Xanthomonas oryzae]|uniref:hypothetical protein n=1 Tax=Xanthomonas oryzae TaxID=347 RepID=UPI0010335EE8|nr:hypothetical protein [Xanthomonas oryzae]QBG98544.1 hypothetical protein EYC56_02660 [Xanthomonas oryzae]